MKMSHLFIQLINTYSLDVYLFIIIIYVQHCLSLKGIFALKVDSVDVPLLWVVFEVLTRILQSGSISFHGCDSGTCVVILSA